jgi:hypothetical protein
MVAHIARDYADAEQRDLEYWQSKTPQERLSALVAIHRDVKLAQQAREDHLRRTPKGS